MDLGFRGEVADFYHRYRHGYPEVVIDILADAFGLSRRDVVVDLGCGTGQLTLPIARRVRAVVGVDPEPDMLRRAARAAAQAGIGNVTWLVGSDADLPALATLLGARSVGAITVGQALHWMKYQELFPAAAALARPGGGIAVVTNGQPLWLQDTAWSRALRGFLERWLGRELTDTCGTDDESQDRYARALAAAGYDVLRLAVDYDVWQDIDQIVGGMYSALPVSALPPPEERPAFAEAIRAALPPDESFSEHVHVQILAGRVYRRP